MKLLQFVLFCLWLVVSEVTSKKKSPHVVFLLADDLGYNDIGYSQFADVQTPFLTDLASKSLKLRHSYTSFVCSPSRAAIMTGKYPYRYGLQRGGIRPNKPEGLDLNQKLLPQYMRDFGYQTHMVGKWHLGLCKEEFTPLNRGFDSFRGFLGGAIGYYDHCRNVFQRPLHDYWQDRKLLKDDNIYSTDDFANYTVKLIYDNKDPRPMFLYLSLQAIHKPLEVPPNVNLDVRNPRSITREVIKTVDRFAETIVNALKARKMWHDTVFVFTSDNGGSPAMGGSNYPLRGAKHTLWEGGTRIRSFIHGGNLPQGERYTGLFHAVDWLPTIAGLTGNVINDKLDGLDQSKALRRNAAILKHQPRKSFFYNIDTVTLWNGTKMEQTAVRYRFYDEDGDFKDLKLIVGNPNAPSARIHPDVNPNSIVPTENFFADGALYDMTEIDSLLEETALKGREPIKNKMKAMIEEERRNGWVGHVRVKAALGVFGMRDAEGAAYLGPGWC